MYKIGDKVKVGNVVGNIVNVYQDKSIGFLAEGKRKHYYDVGLCDISEDQITLIEEDENGTCQQNA